MGGLFLPSFSDKKEGKDGWAKWRRRRRVYLCVCVRPACPAVCTYVSSSSSSREDWSLFGQKGGREGSGEIFSRGYCDNRGRRGGGTDFHTEVPYVMMMKILETLPVLRSVFCDQQQPPTRSPIYKAGLGGCKHPPFYSPSSSAPPRAAGRHDTHTLHRRRRRKKCARFARSY